MSDSEHSFFLRRCLDLAQQQATSCGGGPFAALVVKDGQIIAEGGNLVTANNDPTAHAEVVAIRRACAALHSFQLSDCVVYSSCEPCPMCLGAIFWSRPAAVYFAATRHQAAAAGFDDSLIYQQIDLAGEQRQIPFCHLEVQGSDQPFEIWRKNAARKDY